MVNGLMQEDDGNEKKTSHADMYCLVIGNRLARYKKETGNNEFEKVITVLMEVFSGNFRRNIRCLRNRSRPGAYF